MFRLAHRSAAGIARAAAIAAVSENWSPPADAARAASHTAAVASSVATSMLAQWCFTAWNMAIGRPNCWRSLAYCGGGLSAFAGDADGLGGEDRAGDVDERLAGARQHGRRLHRRSAPARCDVSGRGSAASRPTRLTLPDVDDGDVVTDADEQHIGEAGADDRAGGTVQRAVAQLDVAAEGDRSARRTVDEPREPRRGDVVGRGGGEHGAGDGGRHERARGDSSAELLDDDDQLLQPIAGAAVLLGDVQAEPAERGRVGVERGVLLVGGFEQRPGG